MPKNPRQCLLPLLAGYLYLAGSASFLGQWDTYDYLKQIVTHQLSDLGFGRPVYIGYNILIWESARRVFGLETLDVEAVAMIATVVFGVAGVVLFHQLAREFFPPPASRMAAFGFALSPMYALYSGFIMTEVPMLTILVASALILWKRWSRYPVLSDVLGGLLFGAAIGIREQAATLGPAFLWILSSRRAAGHSRLRSAALFGGAAVLAVLVPVLSIYVADPAGFVNRIGTWLHAIPLGHSQFRNNLQASLLFAFVTCPAAWLAAGAAGICALSRRRRPPEGESPSQESSIPNGLFGVVCGIGLPIAALWRDADVQMHPRYLLLILPGSLIFCTSIYHRWVRSRGGAAAWAVVHVLVFGAGLTILSPIRQTQTEKMEFARAVRDAVPGPGLMIAGSYSPILDYYRAIGVRPEWRILWTGWDWDAETADRMVRKAWADRKPVYFSEDSLGWRYFESEYLHFYSLFRDCRKEAVIPRLSRVYP